MKPLYFYISSPRLECLRTHLWQILPLAGIVILLLFAGCRSESSSTNKNESSDISDTNDKSEENPAYLRLPIDGAVTTLDPGLTEDTASIELVEQLFLGLTDFDPETYEPVPELATHWTVEDDGLRYHFFLREDVSWTNGVPVTAHDVVWALRRNINPETASPYASMLYILKNAKALHSGEMNDFDQLGVEAKGDYEVIFTLEYAAAYFPAIVGLWVYRPLPREAIDTFGEDWTLPENIQTNGSYTLNVWDKGTLLILKKNDTYFDAAQVAIPEVRYYVVVESSIGMILYERGELDILGGNYLRLPIDEIWRIKVHPSLSHEYANEPQFCTYYYGFNTQKPPVDDPLVRKAISAAIDRRLLIKVVTKGDEEPATTFTRPPIFGAVDPEEGVGIDFDPKQARKWLAEAGYPEGNGFPEITLLHNVSETHKEIAEAVATLLDHYLNISVKIQALEWTAYRNAIMPPNTPELYRFGWCADYPDANNWLYDVFHPKYSPNRVNWENEAFAQLVEQAQLSSEPKERKKLYHDAEKILTEEVAAIIPLYFYTAQYLVNPRIKGWYSMALGGQHIRNWSLEE